MKNFLLAFLLFSTQILFSQYQPKLIKDITEGEIIFSSSPTKFIEAGGMTYFVAFHRIHGLELWKSDGTESGTKIVKDLKPGTATSFPENLIEFKGELYFTAADSLSNRIQLMKTDGTVAGTVRYSSLNLTSFTEFVKTDSLLFFTAADSLNDIELYKTDGTDAGTIRIKDIHPTSSSYPGNLTVVDNTLFFTAEDTSNNYELWKSDGTESGTILVKDIDSNINFSSFPRNLTAVNQTLFFSADNSKNGRELWKSDGTDTGTVMVKDIILLGSSSPDNLNAVDSSLFFTTYEGLWTSDGTDTGTFLLKKGVYPKRVVSINNKVVFEAKDTLWASDSTTNGTVSILNDIPPIVDEFHTFIKFNNKLYFATNTFNSRLGNELWSTDGTDSGTLVLKKLYYDLNSGSTIKGLTSINGLLYFQASDSLSGAELWISDGTEQGTNRLKDINKNKPNDSFFSYSKAIGNKVFFGFGNNEHLWITDGTNSGTKELLSRKTRNLVNLKDTLYFVAEQNGQYELWKSDGTTQGTQLAVDIAGQNSSYPLSLVVLNETLFFSAKTSLTNSNRELWKTDGTSAGTQIVKVISPNPFEGSNPSIMGVLKDEILFFADDDTHGRELWKSDGTASGTVMVKDINSGSEDSRQYYSPNVVFKDSLLFFVANDGVHGHELWKTDGSEAGTEMVKDIGKGKFFDNIIYLLPFGNTILMVANDSIHGFELWKTDGSEAGTEMIKDIYPGSMRSFLDYSLVPYQDSMVLFTANDGIHGYEIWRTNGTEAGTYILKDIQAGKESSNVYIINSDNHKLYMTANDGIHGQELWQTDGTAAGTILSTDLEIGSEGSNPYGLNSPPGALFFGAKTSEYGNELWRLGPCIPSLSSEIVESCDSFTWRNGVTYTESNYSAVDSLINSKGCDSIIQLQLTINKKSFTNDTQIACGDYTWINGQTYTTNNNTAKDTVLSAKGCDSIITLNLAIISIDTSVTQSMDTLKANSEGVAYQWLNCNTNFSPIFNANSRTYIPTKGGSYAVEITDSSCADTSSCYVSTVGIDNYILEKGITVYPNPVNNELKISNENQNIETIDILDINGTLIKRVSYQFNSINVNELSQGVYYIRIHNRHNKNTYKRFVKL